MLYQKLKIILIHFKSTFPLHIIWKPLKTSNFLYVLIVRKRTLAWNGLTVNKFFNIHSLASSLESPTLASRVQEYRNVQIMLTSKQSLLEILNSHNADVKIYNLLQITYCGLGVIHIWYLLWGKGMEWRGGGVGGGEENWISTMTSRHAEPNINILLTRNPPFDSDVRQWTHPLMIPLNVYNRTRGQFECDVT